MLLEEGEKIGLDINIPKCMRAQPTSLTKTLAVPLTQSVYIVTCVSERLNEECFY